jgi:predicted secreted protein
MAVPGYSLLVTAATGISATYMSIDGIKDFSLSDADDLLDITDFMGANVARTRQRIAGLRDATLSLSGDLESTATGFAAVRGAKRTGACSTAFQVWLNMGTSSIGFALVAAIESIEYTGNVEGKAEVSISASVNGTIIDPIT